VQTPFEDPLAVGAERLLVQVRTIFGHNRLNRRQQQLRGDLESLISRHKHALESLLLRYRFCLGVDGHFAAELSRILDENPPTEGNITKALNDLDDLTRSEAWLIEASRSRAAVEATLAN
jgi:hypothetical protein